MNGGTEGRAGVRLAAIAVFIGLPGLLLAATILNIVAIGESRLTIAEQGFQLTALQQRLNTPASDGRPLDTSPIFVKGASRSLASANLQQQLVAAIDATSGQLIETLAIDPIDEEDGQSVRLRATLDIDNNGLVQLLYILESGLPLLDIEAISIRRIDQATEDGPGDRLRVDMTVRAHWKQGAA